MADIFISYSRVDKDFAFQIYQQLQASNQSLWIDQYDIPSSSDWLQEILSTIEGCAIFICILSPTYIQSKTCQVELQRAIDDKKKIVPIVWKTVRPEDTHPEVARLQWIDFSQATTFEAAFAQLLLAVNTDLNAVKLGAKIFQRATDWQAQQQKDAFTLRGQELAEAEQWIAQSGDKEPKPTSLVLQYVNMSRRAERLRSRRAISALTAGICLTVALSLIVSVLFFRVQTQNQALVKQNRILNAHALAGSSREDVNVAHAERNALLSLQSVQQVNDITTRSALFDSLGTFPYLDAVLERPSDGVSLLDDVSFSADGHTMLAVIPRGEGTYADIWEMAGTKRSLKNSFLFVYDNEVQQSHPPDSALISPDGTTIVARYQTGDNTVLWDASTGKLLRTIQDFGKMSRNDTIAVNHSGTILATVDCINPSCNDYSIDAWAMQTGTLLYQLPLAFPPSKYGDFSTQIAFSPNDEYLAVNELSDNVDQSDLRVWNVHTSTPQMLHEISRVGSVDIIECFAFAFDNSTLVFATYTSHIDSLLRFADIQSLQETSKPISLPSQPVNHIAISSDSDTIIAQTLYDTYIVRPYTHSITSVTRGLYENQFRSFALNPTDHYFATIDDKGYVYYWRTVPYSSLSRDYAAFLGVDWLSTISPDGAEIASYFESENSQLVNVYNTKTKSKSLSLDIKMITGFAAETLTSLAFSNNSQMLVIVAFSHIIVWDIKNNVLVALITDTNVLYNTNTIDAYCRAKFLVGDQKIGIVTSSGAPDDTQEVKIFDISSKKMTSHVTTRFALDPSTVTEVEPDVRYSNMLPTMSNDGRFAALAGAKNNVYIWDIINNKLIHTLQRFASSVAKAEFSSDDSRLVTLTTNGLIQVWSYPNLQNLATFTTIVNAVNGEYTTLSDTNPFTLTFGANNKLLFAHDAAIDIWDVNNNELYIRRSESNVVLLATLTSDGDQITSLERDGSFVVRDLGLDQLKQDVCNLARRNLTSAEKQQFNIEPRQGNNC